jgi:hypothetical protein
VPRQYLWFGGQRHLLTLQRGHLLSGWGDRAVDLPRQLFLSGHGCSGGCAASRVSRWVVLQPNGPVGGRIVPPSVDMPDGGLVVRAGAVPDRVGVSDVGAGGGCAVSTRSILSRHGPGGGCLVSVWLVQPVAGHERLDRVCAVCLGIVGVARPRRVRVCLPRWVVPLLDGIAVRSMSRRRVLCGRRESSVALPSGYVLSRACVIPGGVPGRVVLLGAVCRSDELPVECTTVRRGGHV